MICLTALALFFFIFSKTHDHRSH